METLEKVTDLVVETAIYVVYSADVGVVPPIELPLVLLLVIVERRVLLLVDDVDRILVEGVVACVVGLLLVTELFKEVCHPSSVKVHVMSREYTH